MAGTAHMSHSTQSQWKPLSRMRTHEQVVAEIEERLINGSLKAGDRLPPERQFAEALVVSRGAVREALRILEAIGVIEAGQGSGPSSGSVIVKDSVAGMAMVMRIHLQLASFTQSDLVELRLLIEQLAVRKAAGTATVEDIADLRSLVDQMRGVRTAAAYDALAAAFHVWILRASDNALASVLMAAMRDAQSQTGETGFDSGDDLAKTMHAQTDSYAAIVDAIAIGDGDRAAELVAGHIRSCGRAVGSSVLKRAG